MQNDNNSNTQINSFEELIENNQNEVQINPESNRPINNVAAIIFYFLRSFLALGVFIILISIPVLVPDFDLDYIVAREVAINADSIGVTRTVYFNEHQSLVRSVMTFIDNETEFRVIINNFNPEISNLSWLQENLTNILNGEITIWPSSGREIILFYRSGSPHVNSEAINATEIHPYGLFETMRLSNLGLALFQALAMILTTVGVVFILKKEIVSDLLVFKEPKEYVNILLQVIIGTFVVFGAAIIIGLLAQVIGNFVPAANQTQNQLLINLMLRGPGIPLMILAAVIFGPLVEEIVFRKAFFGLIKNKYIALLISAITFGLVHMTSEIFSGDWYGVLVNSIQYIGMGAIFGLIYLKTNKNVWIVTLIHALYNLITLLIILFI